MLRHRGDPAATWRPRTPRRPSTWIGLVTVPVLAAGLLTYGLWAPDHGNGTALAAIVNGDTPVTVNGQYIPLGRQLAAGLAADTTSPYRWVITDPADAKKGLAKGTYAAVLTVPSTFSARATSTAASDPMTAQKGLVDITTSKNGGLVDPVMSRVVAQTTLSVLNQQVVEGYLDEIYKGFTTIHERTQEAADGAGQLADGATQAYTGADQLDDGAEQLATGLGTLSAGADQAAAGSATLATGARTLRAGTKKLSSGANQLADGTGQLADGTRQLSRGLNTLQSSTSRLPAQTAQLADGARQVADGNRQLADTLTPITTTVVRVTDALPRVSGSVSQLRQLKTSCDAAALDPTFCARLSEVIEVLIANAQRVDAGIDSIGDQARQLGDGVNRLADGSAQVADGADQLAAGAIPLTRGIRDAAAGGRQVDAGARQVDKGARQLATGARALNTGAGQLSTGADQLAAGNRSLAAGARQAHAGSIRLAAGTNALAAGLNTLDKGAHTLASGLLDGVGQVPSYTAAQRDHLKAVAATPLALAGAAVDTFGRAASAVFLALGLWLAGLATYLRARAVPADVLTSRRPTWRLALSAARPGLTITLITVLASVVLFGPFLGLSLGSWVTLAVVATVIAVCFTAVNQALVALFGRNGRSVAMVILVLSVVSAITMAVPGLFTTLGPLLPTHGAIVALRAVILGADGLLIGLVQLAVWTGIGLVTTIAVTHRRRNVSSRALRVDTTGRRQFPELAGLAVS